MKITLFTALVLVLLILSVLMGTLATIVFGDRQSTSIQKTIVVGEEIEWGHADEFKRLLDTSPDYLHERVCKQVPSSPLCINKELIEIFDKHSKRTGVPTWIIIGIAFSESKIGTAFNKLNREDCRENTHNWWGIKGRHNGLRAIRDQKIGNGCYLYKFESLDDAVGSFANTISVGYGKCFERKDPVYCMAFNYVGNPDVAEVDWQRRVNLFRP